MAKDKKELTKKQYDLISNVEVAGDNLKTAIEHLEDLRDTFETALVNAERGGVKLVTKFRRRKLYQRTLNDLDNIADEAEEAAERLTVYVPLTRSEFRTAKRKPQTRKVKK